MLVYYEAALSTAEQLEAAREEIGAQDLREPANLGIKAIMGVQSGIPLHGSDLIHTWQARINRFPESLARAMVEHDLRELFPVWYFAEAMQRRDCAAWLHQMLAETALNALGVLAGLNRQYFVPFQFKRTRRFVDSLRIAPEDLTERQRQHLGPGAERAGLVDQGDVGRVGQAGQVAGHRGGADAHEAHVVV